MIFKKDTIKITQILSLLLLATIFSLLLAEVALRTYEKICKNVPFFASIKDWEDPVFGWKGKRIFGDISTGKFKIFIIGDSFTATAVTDGPWDDDEKKYFNVIKQKLNAEVFVYAGKGYGTTQEYLVLNKYYDEIKPDLIILQVCSNDFSDNSWELRAAGMVASENFLPRPYWSAGSMEYRYPKGSNVLIRELCYSRLFYRLFILQDALLPSKNILPGGKKGVGGQGMAGRYFGKSTLVTNILIKKMKAKSKETPIVAFAVDDNNGFSSEQFRSIFAENNIEFIESVPKIIQDIQNKGVNLTIKDGRHWNAQGHAICGNILVEELAKRGYVKIQ